MITRIRAIPHWTGTPWPAHEWTRRYGSPGEVDDNGNIVAIDIVPKPFQKPHPMLFQAFSQSEATIRWAAREGLIPTFFRAVDVVKGDTVQDDVRAGVERFNAALKGIEVEHVDVFQVPGDGFGKQPAQLAAEHAARAGNQYVFHGSCSL